MRVKKLFLYSIMFIILAFSVAAEDFNVVSYKQNIFSCEYNLNHVDTLFVQNTGLFAHSYEIMHEGNAGEWAIAIPNNFILAPGESAVVYVYVTSPIGIKGSYDLITRVKSEENIVKRLEQDIVIDKCVNSKTTTEYSEINTCPGRTISFPINVENTGSFDEKYSFYTDKDMGALTFSSNNFILDPNGKLDVYVYLQLPSELYGEHYLNLFTEAEASGIVTKLPIFLNISPCYDFSISTKDQEKCKLVDSNVDFTLANYADADNYFNIRIKGPDWAEQTVKQVFLKARTSVVIENITVNPPKNAKPEEITVEIETEYGELKANKSFILYPAHCYDLKIDVKPNIASCACERQPYEVTLKNKGTIDDAFNYSIKAGNKKVNLSLQEGSVDISGGNEITYDVNVDNPCKKDKYDIEIKAISEKSGLIYKNKTGVDLIKADRCRKADLILRNRKHNLTSKRISSSIEIRNSGYMTTMYEIYAFPQEMIDLKINRITLQPNSGFNVSFDYLVETTGKYKVSFKAVALENSQSYIEDYSIRIYDDSNKNIYYYIILFGGACLVLFGFILFLVNYNGRRTDDVKHIVKDKTNKKRKQKKVKSIKKKAENKLKKQDTGKDKAKEQQYRLKPFFKYAVVLILILLVIFGMFYYVSKTGILGNFSNVNLSRFNMDSVSFFKSFNVSADKTDEIGADVSDINSEDMNESEIDSLDDTKKSAVRKILEKMDRLKNKTDTDDEKAEGRVDDNGSRIKQDIDNNVLKTRNKANETSKFMALLNSTKSAIKTNSAKAYSGFKKYSAISYSKSKSGISLLFFWIKAVLITYKNYILLGLGILAVLIIIVKVSELSKKNKGAEKPGNDMTQLKERSDQRRKKIKTNTGKTQKGFLNTIFFKKFKNRSKTEKRNKTKKKQNKKEKRTKKKQEQKKRRVGERKMKDILKSIARFFFDFDDDSKNTSNKKEEEKSSKKEEKPEKKNPEKNNKPKKNHLKSFFKGVVNFFVEIEDVDEPKKQNKIVNKDKDKLVKSSQKSSDVTKEKKEIKTKNKPAAEKKKKTKPKKSERPSSKKSSTEKSVSKKTRRKKSSTMPEPWSKVTKYKKIDKEF